MFENNESVSPNFGLIFFREILHRKWQIWLLYYLSQNITRPGQLHRKIPEASRRIVNLHLSQLEKLGVINKKVFPGLPPKVEYQLTDLGQTIIPLLQIADEWGKNNTEAIKNILIRNRVLEASFNEPEMQATSAPFSRKSDSVGLLYIVKKSSF
jgi:DNA-binding HxlR family transcriptional regulator